MKATKAEQTDATVDFTFRVQSSVAEAVQRAAGQQLITKSAFACRAVLRDLEARGAELGGRRPWL